MGFFVPAPCLSDGRIDGGRLGHSVFFARAGEAVSLTGAGRNVFPFSAGAACLIWCCEPGWGRDPVQVAALWPSGALFALPRCGCCHGRIVCALARECASDALRLSCRPASAGIAHQERRAPGAGQLPCRRKPDGDPGDSNRRTDIDLTYCHTVSASCVSFTRIIHTYHSHASFTCSIHQFIRCSARSGRRAFPSGSAGRCPDTGISPGAGRRPRPLRAAHGRSFRLSVH